jgi:hypothetical protein
VLPVEIAKSLMHDPWNEATSSLNYYSMLLETMIYADGSAIAYQHYGMLKGSVLLLLLLMGSLAHRIPQRGLYSATVDNA